MRQNKRACEKEKRGFLENLVVDTQAVLSIVGVHMHEHDGGDDGNGNKFLSSMTWGLRGRRVFNVHSGKATVVGVKHDNYRLDVNTLAK